MEKINLYLFIGIIAITCSCCSNKSESKENIQDKKISQDILKIQNKNDYCKSFIDIIDSIAAIIALEQKIENCKKSSFKERNEDLRKINHSQFQQLNEETIQGKYLNSVKGHLEQTSISGNFTGSGMDTLYVSKKIDLSYTEQENENPDHLSPIYLANHTHFLVISNNPLLPKIEIYGRWNNPPKLVFEGDLDGDGKDEWGYLVTGENSQWRQYNVFNYDLKNKTWRYLYKDSYPDEFLSTRQSIRASGKEIVEKGVKKGEIKINYADYHDIFRDTLVKANYLSF